MKIAFKYKKMLWAKEQQRRKNLLKKAEFFADNVTVMFSDIKKMRKIRQETKAYIRELTVIIHHIPNKRFRQPYLEIIDSLLDVKRSIRFFIGLLYHEPEDIVTFKNLV